MLSRISFLNLLVVPVWPFHPHLARDLHLANRRIAMLGRIKTGSTIRGRPRCHLENTDYVLLFIIAFSGKVLHAS